MGENITHRGESLKLGTCEDLYYVTFEQLKAIAPQASQRPGNLPPAEYLNPAHGFRYRFPFPQEDSTAPGTFADFNYGLLIGIPKDSPIVNSDHSHQTQSVSVNGAYNVNVMIPCPASAAFDAMNVKHSPVPDTHPLEIVQQKQVDGELWVVVRCGWCGNKYRLPREEAQWLADYLKQYDRNDDCGQQKYYTEVARRIMAGYKAAVAV
jgi:hypothetical protein